MLRLAELGLKARLLLGDVSAYRRSAEQVGDDARSLMSLKASAVYKARCVRAAARGPAAVMEYCPRDVARAPTRRD